jgi:hypothetical protein
VATITLDVAPYLGHPVWSIVPGLELRDASLKVAPMPEISVDEDNDACPTKDYVGSAG